MAAASDPELFQTMGEWRGRPGAAWSSSTAQRESGGGSGPSRGGGAARWDGPSPRRRVSSSRCRARRWASTSTGLCVGDRVLSTCRGIATRDESGQVICVLLYRPLHCACSHPSHPLKSTRNSAPWGGHSPCPARAWCPHATGVVASPPQMRPTIRPREACCRVAHGRGRSRDALGTLPVYCLRTYSGPTPFDARPPTSQRWLQQKHSTLPHLKRLEPDRCIGRSRPKTRRLKPQIPSIPCKPRLLRAQRRPHTDYMLVNKDKICIPKMSLVRRPSHAAAGYRTGEVPHRLSRGAPQPESGRILPRGGTALPSRLPGPVCGPPLTQGLMTRFPPPLLPGDCLVYASLRFSHLDSQSRHMTS